MILGTALVLLSLKEQVEIQGFMSIMRFLVIALMFATCLAVKFQNTNLNSTKENNASLSFIDGLGVGVVLPIVLTTNLFQSCIPNTLQFVRKKHKTIPKIVHYSIGTTTVLFLLIGLVIPASVSDIESTVTLN